VIEFEQRRDLTLLIHSALVTGGEIHRRPRLYPAHRRRRILTPESAPLLALTPGFAIVVSKQALEAWVAVDSECRPWAFEWDHDDWATTVAAALGETALLSDPLVRYRQHDHNVWGPPASGAWGRLAASLAYRGEEEQCHREAAVWAREHVRLLERVAKRSQNSSGAPGPLARARLWAHVAETNDRRAQIYALENAPGQAIGKLTANGFRGDYRRRSRGGLGIASFFRDSLHCTGVLDLLARFHGQN
jgi:hypothetical protein